VSIKAMNWAFEQDLQPPLKVILLALADWADGDGIAFPGQKSLSEKTSIPERSLRRHLAELEELGYIARRRRTTAGGQRTSDEYKLLSPTGQIGRLPTGQIEGANRPTVAGTENHQIEPPVTTTGRTRQTQFPPGFAPDNSHCLKAMARAVDVDAEFLKFMDYHLARASKFADWGRAFHTWLNNARPEPGTGVKRRNLDRPSPTERMNNVLAIKDPNEQGMIE
jgi:hypothetical protein